MRTIQEIYFEYSDAVETELKYLIECNVHRGHEVDFNDHEIKDLIYEILEQINIAEPLDMDFLTAQGKAIAVVINEDIELDHKYPCCGGSGCSECLT